MTKSWHTSGRGMKTNPWRFVFIERHRQAYQFRVMCALLDVSASGYYRWRQRPKSARQREDWRLRVEIRAIFRAGQQTYGRPRAYEALRGADEEGTSYPYLAG